MTQAQSPSYGKVFDEIAVEYDRLRPTYPDELVDRACRAAQLGPGDRVLEVGCGTGQLTRSLLARGLQVSAVEPGERLMSLADESLRGLGVVEFANARFEDAPLPEGHFRAVLSASAFHWIDPDVGWEKAARVLAPEGTLALIQYCGLDERCSDEDQQALEALRAAMARVSPELAAAMPAQRGLATIEAGVQQRRTNVSEVWSWIGGYDLARAEASALFGDVQLASVPTVLEQTAEELNALLGTTSLYRRLSADQRAEIEREHFAIGERLGRPMRSCLAAVAVTARRGAVS